MAKNLKQCENCKRFFPDSKLNRITRQPNILMKVVFDQKAESELYCDECIEVVR